MFELDVGAVSRNIDCYCDGIIYKIYIEKNVYK